MADPATALFDDSHGTTGPEAQQRIERAHDLTQEYSRMPEALAIPDSQNANPQIDDSGSIDTDATSNPRLQALDQSREDPEKVVKQMITLFHLGSENHVRCQNLTSVKHPSAASANTSLDKENILRLILMTMLIFLVFNPLAILRPRILRSFMPSLRKSSNNLKQFTRKLQFPLLKLTRV